MRAPISLVADIAAASSAPVETTAAACSTASHPSTAVRTAVGSVTSPITTSSIGTPSAPAVRANRSRLRTRNRTVVTVVGEGPRCGPR